MKSEAEKQSQQTPVRAASRAQQGETSGAESALQRQVDESVVMQRQREKIEKSFGQPFQRQGVEEEELLQGKFSQPVQREIEEEELVQGKFVALQRQPEEEELMQGKFASPLQRETEAAAAPNETGLPDNLKSGIESLSGMDISDVRVHYNSPKPAQLNAHAYAQGNDIHLGSGQEKHLPHEAWHAVQQRQGRVQPTMQMAGEKINDDDGLEKEADVMGDRASRFSG